MKGYSMVDFMKGNKLETFISTYESRFYNRFNLKPVRDIAVLLKFESYAEATEFYQEVKFNVRYAHYKVTTTDCSDTLILSGGLTLFEYFGSEEPNVLTISRMLGIKIKISYTQDYSGNTFTGEVVSGELLSRHLIVNVSKTLPELALGSLAAIGSTIEEFETLLTRIYYVKEVALI